MNHLVKIEQRLNREELMERYLLSLEMNLSKLEAA